MEYAGLLSLSQYKYTIALLTFSGVSSIFYLIYIANYKNANLKIRTIDLLLFLIGLYIMVNSYFIQNSAAFSSRFYDLLGLSLLYLIIRGVSKNKTWLLLLFLALGGLAQAIYGELQLFDIYPSLHAGFPLTGSFFNPGPYAGYLAVVFPAALGLYLFADNRTIKTAWIVTSLKYGGLFTSVAILLVLPVSASRAAWLAVACSSLFLCFFRYTWNKKLRIHLNSALKKTLGFALGAILLLVSIAAMYWLKRDSADGRLLIWKASLELIRKNPLLGIGHDRFRAGYMEAQAGYFNENPTDSAIALADDVVYAFNEGIQLLVEQGIMGFVLVLVVLIFLFRIRGNNQSPEIWIAQAGLVSLLVFGMFSYPSHILPIKICGTIYLAILTGKSTLFWKIKSNNPIRWIGLSLMVFLSVTILWRANKLYGAKSHWKEAYTYYQRGNYQSANQAYELAYPTFSRDGDFLSNYGKSLSMAGEHVKAVVILEDASNYLNNTVVQTALGDSYQALGLYTEAEKAYQLASDMLPDRFYPKYLLAKLYQETGQEVKMEDIARFLLEKEPKVPSRAVEEIKEEMRSLLN